MQKTSFNDNWRFFLGDPPGQSWDDPDDSTWRVLDLPHDWSIELDRDPAAPSTTSGGFFPMGRGWYRKTFQAPESWREEKVFVEFEGIYMNAEVWLNEHFVCRHPYGYTSFLVDLTPYLRIGKTNSLRVMVDNAAQMNSRWYSGSGIYRPVWLCTAKLVHIGHWGVSVTTPEVTEQLARVNLRIEVWNAGETERTVTLRSRAHTAGGVNAGATESTAIVGPEQAFTFQQYLMIERPLLWSPDSPDLYQVETETIVGGEVTDSVTTTFGIRSISVSADRGFLLNGQPVKMNGGCVHHDNGIIGATSFPRSEERKVELLKASGFNAIRCAHNPPAPAFLDACDRLGMLVMDEAFDCWRTGKNPYDYHVAFDDWWQRDIESMVLRDRNHPSIVMWSIGNEVMERDGRSGGAQIARMLAERVRSVDSTRPISSAICGVWDKERVWEDTDAVFEALDIGGYNYLWRNYAPDHDRHPQRVMAGTESIPGEAFENWMSVVENSYVIGDFVWTSMDYLGESGIGRQHYDTGKPQFLGDYPWHQAYCGDIDLAGFKRPQSYYRDVLWGCGSPLYIVAHYPHPEGKMPTITFWGWADVNASWTWPGREGQVVKVDVYSAAEEVELFLNGRSLGVKLTTNAERRMATFDVVYEPGELKAVGRLADGSTTEWALQTTGAPHALRLTADRPALAASKDSLCYVTVEVVDSTGRLCPDADTPVQFSVEGPGELYAVGSGNPTSTERYRGASQRKAFRGRCVAVVKCNGQNGSIRLRAAADGTQGQEVLIQAIN